MKKFILLLFLLPVISSGQKIVDKENVFSQAELQKLDSVFHQFYRHTNVSLLFYSTPDLDGYTTLEYVQILKEDGKDLGIEKPPLHNNITIIMSKNDRKINFINGHGVEWLVSDKTAKKIIDHFIPFFMEHKFADGIEFGIESYKEILGNYSWEVVEKTLPELTKKDTGKIIKFYYKNPNYKAPAEDEYEYEEYFDEKYGVDIEDAPQFSKKYQLEIKETGKGYKLYFSKHMYDLYQTISKRPATTVYARLADYKKGILELIGIEELVEN